ncbi:MAG: Transcriptional regulator, TetR family protein [bacterium]|nr:Transcriptional regulator, TetR family protein [bacterium]
MAKPRQRRSAEAARHAILDAAERRLAEAGPAALRLQDVAADVGVSHPAVLHHFGSRQGLVRAVVDRAVRRLEAALIASFGSSGAVPPDGAALLERVFATLADGGHARLMAWLMLSGQEALDIDVARASWRAIIDATHALRPRGTTREDTTFTVALAALATFGQAIAGESVFHMAGLGRDAAAPARFRRWLAALLGEHLSVVPPPRKKRRART